MRIAIANFSRPTAQVVDPSHWDRFERPAKGHRLTLFEQPVDWGFHIEAIGVHLLDRGVANEVEFWDFGPQRSAAYAPSGVLRLTFFGDDDLAAYIERHEAPDLFINHGRNGHAALALLEGRCFRVHVPALRSGLDRTENYGAECYLVDSEEYLDDRSMLYVPVVNTQRIRPLEMEKVRDFVYLAAAYHGKRHDILVDGVRRTDLTGHFHPVKGEELDLSGTRITTSNWDETDVVELLATSRIAVYPGDDTSNPAAMWECVAAGLPIVINRDIRGGKHLVVPGVTGELASEPEFASTMREVLASVDSYRPREHFEEHWDTVATIESYLAFFAGMGWSGSACS